MTKNNKIYIVAPKYYGIDTSIRDAFERNGFSAELHNYRIKLNFAERAAKAVARKFPVFEKMVNPVVKIFLVIENSDLLASIKRAKPDVLFIIKGEFIFPKTIEKIKKELKIPVLSYQWDDPFYSHADHQAYDKYRRESFERSMPLFDHIFVYDSDYLGQIKDKGIKHADLLPLATDLRTYKKAELTEEEKKEFGYDVCFVGLPFKNRVKMFNSLNDIRLGVFGDYWDKWNPDMKGDYFKGKAFGEKVLKLYSASKIVLNIHHPQSHAGPNTRTFDILACGAFEIVDHKKDIGLLFDIGKELVCYEDEEDMKKKVHYYLAHPDEMKEIARKGHEKVVSSHTWEHRVKKVLSVLNEKGLIRAD